MNQNFLQEVAYKTIKCPCCEKGIQQLHSGEKIICKACAGTKKVQIPTTHPQQWYNSGPWTAYSNQSVTLPSVTVRTVNPYTPHDTGFNFDGQDMGGAYSRTIEAQEAQRLKGVGNTNPASPNYTPPNPPPPPPMRKVKEGSNKPL